MAILYLWGCKPFLGALGQYSRTIRAEIGRSQKGLFKMSLFVLVVYFKYYILQEECALSRCIEVLYWMWRRGLVSHLFCAHSLRQGVCLTCEEQVPCHSSKKFAPVCSNCACDCAGVNNIEASIPFVIIIVELRGKQPMLKRRHNNLHDFLTSIVLTEFCLVNNSGWGWDMIKGVGAVYRSGRGFIKK